MDRSESEAFKVQEAFRIRRGFLAIFMRLISAMMRRFYRDGKGAAVCFSDTCLLIALPHIVGLDTITANDFAVTERQLLPILFA
jgi:hypothetical protein